LQVAYNGLGVSNAVLREAQVPNGNAHVWSFTADPKIGLKPYHGVNTYLIGGRGILSAYRSVHSAHLATCGDFRSALWFFSRLIPADKI